MLGVGGIMTFVVDGKQRWCSSVDDVLCFKECSGWGGNDVRCWWQTKKKSFCEWEVLEPNVPINGCIDIINVLEEKKKCRTCCQLPLVKKSKNTQFVNIWSFDVPNTRLWRHVLPWNSPFSSCFTFSRPRGAPKRGGWRHSAGLANEESTVLAWVLQVVLGGFLGVLILGWL